MAKFRTLTIEELGALQRFARAYGRRWKSTLREVYWYNARPWRGPGSDENDGYALHGLRNCPNWGHEGLAAFSLKGQPNVAD